MSRYQIPIKKMKAKEEGQETGRQGHGPSSSSLHRGWRLLTFPFEKKSGWTHLKMLEMDLTQHSAWYYNSINGELHNQRE